MVLLLGVGYRTGKYMAPENDAIHDKLAVYQGLVIWVKCFMPKVDVARGVVPLFLESSILGNSRQKAKERGLVNDVFFTMNIRHW